MIYIVNVRLRISFPTLSADSRSRLRLEMLVRVPCLGLESKDLAAHNSLSFAIGYRLIRPLGNESNVTSAQL
jgi:hypothetical protein